MPDIPMTPELKAMFERQRKAFIEKFGREPSKDDPVFFDPKTDRPVPLSEEAAHKRMLQFLQQQGYGPAEIYAYLKTGRLVTADNEQFLTEVDLDEWEDAIDEYLDLEEDGKDRPHH